jgi:ABC-type transporter Mla subunit MlaD
MANSVGELLNQLYQMIDDAKSAFGGGCKIDRDRALDILDEVRDKFPMELDEAKKIVATRTERLNEATKDAERIVAEAQEEANRVLREANEQAARLVDESELQQRVKAKANEMLQETAKRSSEMVRQAQEKAQATADQVERQTTQLREATNQYCNEALLRSEDALMSALNEVRKSRAQFQKLSGTGTEQAKAQKNVPYDAAKEEE